jgi:hypothetical protein
MIKKKRRDEKEEATGEAMETTAAAAAATNAADRARERTEAKRSAQQEDAHLRGKEIRGRSG